MEKLKYLPVGIQTFEKIINGNYIYIDKTRYIYNLLTKGSVYFLSRPRRFGKSLLISTLDEIFQGNKELFKGLWIYESEYEWKKHPVVRIDFSAQKATTPEGLATHISREIDYIAEKYNITISQGEYFARFKELLHKLSAQGKIAILIDEYDKPIIDHITNPLLAVEMREVLKGFYSVIKSMDACLRFVLLTGVSKFSKAGVFSGLNQLYDISMDDAYSSMLGITEEELDKYFSGYMDEYSAEKNISREMLRKEIRRWYDGYCFSGTCANVYNPFSTLLLFQSKSFKNFWFESGTPSFLVNLIKEKNFELTKIPAVVSELSLSTYEVENLEPLPLLFQTGYLTIKHYSRERMLYTLDYPNYEIKNAFLERLLYSNYTRQYSESALYDMVDALRAKDAEKFFEILKVFFANIPYDIQVQSEKYYQTVLFLLFTLMGLKTEVEVRTNTGRIDAVVNDSAVFVFEFKLNGTKEEALEQIREKKYAEKYFTLHKPVYIIGVAFANKNVAGWIIEQLR